MKPINFPVTLNFKHDKQVGLYTIGTQEAFKFTTSMGAYGVLVPIIKQSEDGALEIVAYTLTDMRSLKHKNKGEEE